MGTLGLQCQRCLRTAFYFRKRPIRGQPIYAKDCYTDADKPQPIDSMGMTCQYCTATIPVMDLTERNLTEEA